MKKITFFVFLVFLIITNQKKAYSFSIIASTINPPQKASQSLSINAVINLSAKECSKLTGKKMNVWNKLTFSVMKIKMKHDLKKNPNLTLNDYSSNDGKKPLGTGWLILIVVAAVLLILFIIFAISLGSIGY